MVPAQVEKVGIPPARRCRRGASSPKTRINRLSLLDSPPGSARAWTLRISSAVRTGNASAPAWSKAARGPRTSPCSASTPTRTMASGPPDTRAALEGRRRRHLGHYHQFTQGSGAADVTALPRATSGEDSDHLERPEESGGHRVVEAASPMRMRRELERPEDGAAN